MYQYSAEGDWSHPHFEKLAQIQADDLFIYSLAYARLRKPEYLAVAESIHRYLAQFLTSTDGVFYVSQDADLIPGQHAGDFFGLDAQGRRIRGVPHLDTHVYSQDNGELIQAELRFAPISSTGNEVARAEKTARWIIAHRAGADGIFRHAEGKEAGPYLGDTLSTAAACLDLYESTAESVWLIQAEKSARAIAARFSQSGAGYVSAVKQKGSVLIPLPQADENLALARFANRLFQYTGKKIYRKMAESSFRFVLAPGNLKGPFLAPGVLTVDGELNREPLHLTIVSDRRDPKGRELFRSAVAYPAFYRRVEWLDPTRGKMSPRQDVQYPKLARPAAFVCTQGRCSLPAFTAEELASRIERLEK